MALGEAAGLHFSEVSLLERGGRDPRLSTIAKLARGLGIPIRRLLDGIE
jgi:transcriptional regulator with XRE-family HTH domain